MNKDYISIRGAREHNLKDVSIDIPRNALVVITGLSGSGKSSLAFDTIYAEGQRRYVESLSSYARMFLGRVHKPLVDKIEGLSPAICIDQKSTSHNPRSTVGTVTEIYDYLRLLYARIGKAHCYECGRRISQQTAEQVVDALISSCEGARAYVMAPVVIGKKGEFVKLLADLSKEGFSRVRIDGEFRTLDEEIILKKQVKHTIEVVVDRIVIRQASIARVTEAAETALKLAAGTMCVHVLPSRTDGQKTENRILQKDMLGSTHTRFDDGSYDLTFSLGLACPEHGHSMAELEPRDFSFNAPYGACPVCEGIGTSRTVEVSALISDPTRSFDEGVLSGIIGRSNYYTQIARAVILHEGENPTCPWKDLSSRCKDALINGIGDTKVEVTYHTLDGRITHWQAGFEGLKKIVAQKFEETTSQSMRTHYGKAMREDVCASCMGKRLRPEYLAVTLGDKSIIDFCDMSCSHALQFLNTLEFTPTEEIIAQPILKEITARLQFMVSVGLDYLTLSRSAQTLSGGEAQRIRLATQIGAGLVGVLYVLDEPSIGLHQRDNDRLIATLKALRDLGNTVIVVEHDEDTIRNADFVVDMGPFAGSLGGEVTASGTPLEIAKNPHSLTGAYLRREKTISVPSSRRMPSRGSFILKGAHSHNLKHVDLEIEYGTFTAISGVSGSGKSTLIEDTLAPALSNLIMHTNHPYGAFESLEGCVDEVGKPLIDKVIDIDQSPIGRTPRSNPATYIGLWDDLRDLFSSLPESKAKGFGKGRFSFNVPGGRCEACKGDGQIKIEMNFLPDVFVPCEACEGTRYNRETLSIHYKDKTISDILDMTVADARAFFSSIPKIKRKLDTLYQVGLGYIHLGQSATTLSGGEAQRVKLARELHRQQTGKTVYILDEPTTGLHFEDVRMLIGVLQALVDAGNTMIVIEHNLDVLKVADRIIDLGPEGGDKGGRIVCQGTPEDLARSKKSITGRYLKPYLSR